MTGTYTKEYKENIVKEMLLAIGENPNRAGLKGTPERVVRMWKELFRGYDREQLPKITTFMNGEDGISFDQMVVDTGDFYSHCEHHMVPFFGKYWFAYIPSPNGKILGLSKVARIVDFYAAKLQIQERLVKDIVDELWSALTISSNSGEYIKPLGMALVMEGEHLCKTMRGAKKKGKMVCSEMRGVFRDNNNQARNEFLHFVRG